MSADAKAWHISRDCLEPLADGLVSLANRFNVGFNVGKYDRLQAEYRAIEEAVGFDTAKLTGEERARQEAIAAELNSQRKPPSPVDVEMLFDECRIDTAADMLRFHVSPEYGNDFLRQLTDLQKRFFALHFKCSQIINGDEGKESTTSIRYPVQRLADKHYATLRELFPDGENYPERDEMPEELRRFETEVLDEYALTEKAFRETAKYVRHVSALVRSKRPDLQEPAGKADGKAGGGKRKKAKKRGPKGPRNDAKEDRRIFDGWKASGCTSIAEYAEKELGKTTRREIRDVELAIDRERKRRKRKNSK